MAKIRKVEIENFRCLKSLSWMPMDGINCLIGPGDSGKSTILDAIDLCVGARRTAQFTDSDFYNLDVTQPISITLTLGDLSDSLKSIEAYGLFLRSFDPATGQIEDEPESELETVLTLRLVVESDLEPVWTLVSERAEQQDVVRSIAWKDRISIAPTRLGTHSGFNLSWTRGSVLNRISDERAEVGAGLVKAARDARSTFGDQADKQLSKTLGIVTKTAKELGVPVGDAARALLDAHSVSFGDGAISLHNASGIPLRSLGTGSTRLLIAGLQREAADQASIVLIDEVEHGLEPHRLTRLLDSLGAKEKCPPLQVFLTTHSPVALRELAGNQLFVVRRTADSHLVCRVGIEDDIQSTMRLDPEAFLATTVVVCEGASEVGFIRGLDEHRVSQGLPALSASGVAFVDTGGGDANRCFYRGKALQRLGYRVVAVLDNDKPPAKEAIDEFLAGGGKVLIWRVGRALEDELFQSLALGAIVPLIKRAIELTEDGLVDNHIKTTSSGKKTLADVGHEIKKSDLKTETRALLGKASRIRKAGWFKSLSKMEGVARDIVGPNLDTADPEFKAMLDDLFAWAHARS